MLGLHVSVSTDPAVYFVPVLRAVDNSIGPKLSGPCTLQELEGRGSPVGHKLDSPVMSGAIAGPMSPLQAQSFYKEWRSPSNRKEWEEATNVKRSDPDRGMERIGRYCVHCRRRPPLYSSQWLWSRTGILLN